MAPALASDTVVDKIEQVADCSETCGSMKPASTDGGVLGTLSAQNCLAKNGRRRRRSLFTFQNHGHEHKVNKTKKMNPTDGSSIGDNNTNGSVVNSSEQLESKKMCGSNVKQDSGAGDAPAMESAADKPSASHQRDGVAVSDQRCLNIATRSTMFTSGHMSPKDLETSGYDTCAKRHAMLTRRAAKLESRIRRLQSKQAISHTRRQIAGLVDNQKQQVVKNEGPNTALDLKDAHTMSTSALVHMVQKWQSQQPYSRRPPRQEGSSVLTMDDDVCVEIDQVAGHLVSNMNHLKRAVETDATDSSSGGESCDEGDYDYDCSETSKPSLQKRVDWKWSKDRCDIAARWTWLQAQVSDLEYRIRQQSEIHKQIRQKKGEVILGEAIRDSRLEMLHQSNMSPLNVTPIMSNMDKQCVSLKNQLGNIYTPSPVQSFAADGGVTIRETESITPNGLIAQSSFANQSSNCNSSEGTPTLPALHSAHDYTFVAARCRPTVLGKYRKRKLLRTSSVHSRSKKLPRLSTVKCHCYPPITPCAMCGGRYSNTKEVDPVVTHIEENIALLDHSYHQVLSLQEDIPLSVQFESMLKTGRWQSRSQSKSNIGQFSIEKKRGQYRIKPKRNVVKKPASLEVLSRIKNKYAAERIYSVLPISPDRKRLKRISGMRIRKRKSALQGRQFGYGSNKYMGGDSATLREMKLHERRKRAESAYDINNIVIPYSVAASTRVEKLQYKEILTPSWRIVDNLPLGAVSNTDQPADNYKENAIIEANKVTSVIGNCCDETSTSEEMVEDLSDDLFHVRHERSEQDEKSKFMTPVTGPNSHQKRPRGRASEVVSVVGVMTPDPSSPDTAENHQRVTPSTTPTALQTSSSHATMHTSFNNELLDDSRNELLMSRRRASSVSSTLSAHNDRLRSSCLDDYHCGWSARSFPLNDNDFAYLLSDLPPDNAKYSLRASRAVHVPRTSTSRDVIMYDEALLDSPPQSPSSSVSTTGIDDDKEWTVKPVNSRQSSLILKIAKR